MPVPAIIIQLQPRNTGLGAVEGLGASTRRPHGRRLREQAAAAVRAGMEPAEYEAAWAAGQAAPLEQVIAEALEEAPVR